MLRFLIAALWLAADSGVVSVQVNAVDERGRPLPAVADAVVRALVVTGVTVVVGPDAHNVCAERCVRLTLSRRDAERWRLEARGPGHASGGEIKVPASSGSLELARALAIQARLLLPLEGRDTTPPTQVKPVGEGLPVAVLTPRPAASSAPPSAERPSVPTPPPAAPPELLPSELAAAPLAVPTAPVASAVSPPAPPSPSPEPDRPSGPSRVAFAAAATVLSGVGSGDGSGLTAYGATLSARVTLVAGLEARLGLSMLDPWSARDIAGPYRAHARPMSATLQAALPPLPNLRLGAGAELVAIEVDRQGGAQDTSAWTLGALARAEYTQPLGAVSLAFSVHAGYHPNAGTGASGPYGTMSCFPQWSVGGSLGLEFPLL